MGLRVTTRSSPRTDRYFPYGDTTAAAAGADDALTGPFTLAQVCELFYRVRKMRLVGEVTHERYIDPPPEEGPLTEVSSTSMNVVTPRRNTSESGDPEIANEIEVLEQSGVSLAYFDTLVTAAFGWTEGGDPEAMRDETGGYWLRLRFFVGGVEYGDAFISSDPDLVGDTIDFDATLTLGGADFSIPAKALAMEVTAASLAITVEEWWPYATSAGAAAWNTATGAAVNGGPGA